MSDPGARRPAPGATEDPAGAWSTAWHRVTGLLLVAYLTYTLVELAVLRADPGSYNRLVDLSASLGGRLVAWAVVLALVFHGLAGLRILVLEATGGSERLAARTRAAVVFVTAFAAAPAGAVLLRPELEGWWA